MKLRLPEGLAGWISLGILIAVLTAAVHLAVWPSWIGALLCVALLALLVAHGHAVTMGKELTAFKSAFAEDIGTAFAKGYADGVQRRDAGPLN